MSRLQTIAAIGIVCVAILAPLIVVICLAPRDPFGGDTGNIRFVLDRDVPIGSSLATVSSYAHRHFESVVWDAESRCISAAYTIESGRYFRVVTSACHVHLFFDASDRLVEVRQRNMFTRETLMSPAQREAAQHAAGARQFPEVYRMLGWPERLDPTPVIPPATRPTSRPSR